MLKPFVAAVALAIAGASTAQEPGVTLSIPAEHPAGCFASAARIPREIVPHLPSLAVMRFTVGEDGTASGVSIAGVPSHNLETYLRTSLNRCAWTPAADTRGVPMTVAVLMPVRFAR